MNKMRAISNLVDRQGFHIPFKTLVLCLCLGSLSILPLTQIGPFVLEIHEVESENNNLSDYAEFDDEFFISAIVLAMFAELAALKSRLMNLDFRPAYLSPESPPPKQ